MQQTSMISKAKTEALTEQFHTISAKMYQQAQAQQQAAGGAGPDMGAADAGSSSLAETMLLMQTMKL